MSKPSLTATADIGFKQEPPQLGNQYEDDIVLQNILKKTIPKVILNDIEPDLVRFGQRVVEDIAVMGDNVETPSNYPQLRQYDAWCRRIDEITTAPGWKQLNDVAAEEGLIAIAYERKQKEFSRVYQFAKQYLYSSSSAMYSCPLSMTDGATRVTELLGTDEMKAKYFTRLTSRDPNKFWTSGQWMTERPGGSDVGNTETQAELIDEATNTWSVSGFKWFSSATTADLTMLLARNIDPKDNTVKPTSRGLSLYVAELRKPDGSLNGVRVHRLKNKYGTKGLPTAELELDGMKAHMLGQPGRGVPCIASILNITRIYSCFSTLSALRRSLAIAKDFSLKRFAFGKTLDKKPLHITTLAQLELTFRACAQISFFCSHLLGRTECLETDDMALLRFLTPMAKAYVCKIGAIAISEAMESLGGQGYMEEIGVGRQLRDAQVNCIWEGTTNVLAMDVFRVIKETKGAAVNMFIQIMNEKTSRAVSAHREHLDASGKRVQIALENIGSFVKASSDPVDVEATIRQLTFAFGRTLAGVLLIEQASWGLSNNATGSQEDVIVAQRWCITPEFIQPLTHTNKELILEEARIVFGSDAKL